MSADVQELETLVVETQNKPDATIIWLHGLGADGHDFESLVPELRLENLAIRFLFPHAPLRPISLNGGNTMRGWYDISSLEFGQSEDHEGIRESARSIESLIEQQIHNGISNQRILLAGFSQGSAIALHTGLRYQKPLNSLIALSGYLPLATTLASEASTANKNTPVFMAHGTLDDVVATEFGRRSYEIINNLKYPVSWHEYRMGHSLSEQEIHDIREWIIHRLDEDRAE